MPNTDLILRLMDSCDVWLSELSDRGRHRAIWGILSQPRGLEILTAKGFRVAGEGQGFPGVHKVSRSLAHLNSFNLPSQSFMLSSATKNTHTQAHLYFKNEHIYT